MHLDDDAELYALGLLPADRGAAIEAHLAVCAACLARVVAAEATSASLAAALPIAAPSAVSEVPEDARSSASARSGGRARASAPRRAWSALAAAAALVFAASTVVEGFAAHATSARLAATDGALVAIAGSHFNHVTLTGDRGVIAKALYARDGSWCYVVARGVPLGAHVVLRGHAGAHGVPSGRAAHDAGALVGDDPGTLFVREPGRVAEIAVVAAGRIVARAVPAY